MRPTTTRRRFMFVAGATGATVLTAGLIGTAAAEAEMVDPASPQAVALGYVVDAASVDTAKFKRYEAGQLCSNCQLYQGAADAEAGPCVLFAGKAVAANGWCNSWAQKVG